MRLRLRLQLLAAVAAVCIVLAPPFVRPVTAQLGGTLQTHYLLAAGTTNATVVTGCRPTNLYTAEIFSIAGHNVFLKLYNTCAAPTSASTPQLVIGAAVGMQSTGLSLSHTLFNPPLPVRFSTGLAYRTTIGIATANDDAVPANTVVINLTYTAG